MFDANPGTSNATLVDQLSFDQSNRLREIMTGGLTAAFQLVYPAGERMPFAIEGIIRGPAGSSLEAPDLLFRLPGMPA